MTWLDNSRVFAIFAVIFVHVSVGVPWQSEAGSFLWAYGLTWDVLVRWCVPVFVMVSGALLLAPHDNESLLDFYKKRMGKVLLPIFFWSLLYIVWGYFRENVQEPFTLSYVIGKITSGLPYYHMWYMYMLLGLYLFTPLFRVVVAHMKTKELVFFIALMFGIEAIQSFREAWYVGESRFFLLWFLTYLPYYFTGYLVRTQVLPVSTRKLAFTALGIAILVPTALCLVNMNTSHGEGGVFFKNLSPSNILLSLSLIFLLRRIDKPVLGAKLTSEIAKLSFGIYLIHMIPLAYLHDQKWFWGMFSPYIYIPAFSLAVLVVTAGIAWVIGRIPVLKRVVGI